MGTIRLPFAEIQSILEEILILNKCPGHKAKKVSYEMTRNSLEGVYSHGINRFARLIRNISEGIVKPEADPAILNEAGAMANVDGNLGLGIVNAWFCMEHAIGLAGEHGIGLVALRNTNHWLRAATYGYQACDAGMAAICFTNTMPNMPTWGARDSRLGNNPLVFAFPRTGGHIITDMAMSQFSYGALEVAKMESRLMPVDAGFDEEGKLTRDPEKVIKTRRILPTGYWKGASLSFLLDIFAGTLSAGNTVSSIGELPGDEHGLSQVFLAIDYKRLVSPAEAERIVEHAVRDLLSSEPAEESGRVIYTGEMTEEYRQANLAAGIPVDENVWEEILSLRYSVI